MRKTLTLAIAGLVLATGNLPAASVIQFSDLTYNVREGANAQARITVQRVGGLDTVVDVGFSTTNVSATGGLDYLDMATTLTFEVGETNRFVAVPILNDGLIEEIETLRVILTNATMGAVLGARSNATVRITDNDKGLQLELANYSVNEDAGMVSVRVVRRDDGDFPVTVNFATTNLTAVAGEDYLDTAGTLTFSPGEVVKYIPVKLRNDAMRESSETFRVALSSPTSGGVLGTPVGATVTITDSDDLVQFAGNTFTNREDSAVIRVPVARGESASASAVDVTTSNGTAMAGLDYTGVTNTLSFAPGERLKFVDIPLLSDDLKESSETFRITLSNPTGAAGLGPTRTVTVTIIDSDPGVGFAQGTYSVWETEPSVALSVIRGGDGWRGPLTVDYRTVDGTAVSGVHFQAASGTLMFGDNQLVADIPIRVLWDPSSQAEKSFSVVLSNLTGGIRLGRNSTKVTIADASRGYAGWAQPTVVGAIGLESGLVEVSWAGLAALSRGDSVTGPWEQLGAVNSPLLPAADLPAAFYQIRNPRVARLYVPPNYDGQTPMPLVLVLHGYGGDATSYRDYFRFESLADARGFLVCHPEGTVDSQGARFWNATEACCNFYHSTVDDGAYLRGLIEEVAGQYVVDRKRIYVTGHSNGGYMSHRMACDHADLIAGIASLAGMTFLDPDMPRPRQPVHVLQIHGTADEVVPYGGGGLVGLQNVALFPGAVATVQSWAGFNGCQGPIWEQQPSMDLDLSIPGLDTTVLRYSNCPPGGAVELWTIHGGTHGPTLHGGTNSSDYSSHVIDWLLAHRKP